MTTPILDMPELSNSANNYLLANQNWRALENALCDFLSISLASGNVSLTNAQFRAAMLFRATGNTVARNLTVPAIKRLFVVQNNGTAVLSVVRGATTLLVAVGGAGVFYADGTTDGLILIAGGGVPTAPPVISETTTSRTLALSDAQGYIRTTNGSAVTITVPPQSSIAWAANAEIHIEQGGVGQITIAAGSGVTINRVGSTNAKTKGQYAVLSLKRVAADTWTLFGLLEAA